MRQDQKEFLERMNSMLKLRNKARELMQQKDRVELRQPDGYDTKNAHFTLEQTKQLKTLRDKAQALRDETDDVFSEIKKLD